MIEITLIDEIDVWDVTLIQDGLGDTIMSYEFSTVSDAVAFMERAADFFETVDDVRVIRPITRQTLDKSDSLPSTP